MGHGISHFLELEGDEGSKKHLEFDPDQTRALVVYLVMYVVPILYKMPGAECELGHMVHTVS